MARIESSVTSVSWIPWDAMEGVRGLITDLGVGHWDLPPPDQLENLDELIDADAIRFANELRAWVEVEGGHITRYGHLGNGRMGQSTLVAESRQVAFAAVALPRPPSRPHIGPVRTDHWWTDRGAATPAYPSQAVRAAHSAHRLDDAGPDHPCRRVIAS